MCWKQAFGLFIWSFSYHEPKQASLPSSSAGSFFSFSKRKGYTEVLRDSFSTNFIFFSLSFSLNLEIKREKMWEKSEFVSENEEYEDLHEEDQNKEKEWKRTQFSNK